MKVIICGSREFTNYKLAERWLNSFCTMLPITEVVSGGARGADKVGELWARIHGVPLKEFPADWEKHGKGAGFIRNGEMVDEGEAVIAFWDGESSGTKNTIMRAMRKGISVFVINTKGAGE